MLVRLNTVRAILIISTLGVVVKLARAGFGSQICVLALTSLCLAAPAWAAPKDKGVVTVDSTTTISMGYGGGNGSSDGNGTGNGYFNGNGQKNGFTVGTSTQESVVLSTSTSSTGGSTTGTGGTGSVSNFVSAVPEPADYALMLTGLAMLGAAVRRRRSAAASSSKLA